MNTVMRLGLLFENASPRLVGFRAVTWRGCWQVLRIPLKKRFEGSLLYQQTTNFAAVSVPFRDNSLPTLKMSALSARQRRERRDYLYRRALVLRDAEIATKRAKLKAALASGKQLDPSIANDKKLRQDYKFDESRADRTTAEELELDDEYAALSGVRDPLPVIITSRDPSSRLSTFAKEIRLLLPNSVGPNRGNLTLANLVAASKAADRSDII